jgi:hypothetical protein
MALADISVAVVDRMERLYRQQLPLLPGARDAVLAQWSSPRSVTRP